MAYLARILSISSLLKADDEEDSYWFVAYFLDGLLESTLYEVSYLLEKSYLL